MRFDSLVRFEYIIGKHWIEYFLTRDGVYFKITTKTAQLIFSSFSLTESAAHNDGRNGTITTIYYSND